MTFETSRDTARLAIATQATVLALAGLAWPQQKAAGQHIGRVLRTE